MTKDEAKDFLCSIARDLRLIYGEDYTSKDGTKMSDAIKALEQEPCEDAISKASVFEIMGNLMSIPYDFDRPINKDDVSESMDAIRALPPVTPIRPKGHWINIDKTHSECDQCGAVFEIVSANGEANYCPNCGTKMDEDKRTLNYADQDKMMLAT